MPNSTHLFNRIFVFFLFITYCFCFVQSVCANLWQWENPFPSANNITGIWGTGANNICAVDENGLITCFNGSDWKHVKHIDQFSFMDIWGINNQWIAVGKSGAIAMNKNGQWEIEFLEISTDLYCVWGTSFSNIYVMGAEGIILHYNGLLWQVLSEITSVTINDVWGTSESNIYAVGYGGTILHFDGVNWGTIENPSSALSTFNSIWGKNENEIYVAGSNGIILAYTGNQWEKFQIQSTNSFSAIIGTSQMLFAFGDTQVLRYDGSQWQDISLPFFSYIHSTWETDNIVYAVGSNGIIMRYENDQWSTMRQGSDSNFFTISSVSENKLISVGQNGAAVIQSSKSQWMPYSFPVNRTILNVSADMAVGVSGTAVLFSDNQWLSLTTNTHNQLNAVWKQGNKYIVVGEKGTILLYDGSTWVDHSTLDAIDLYAVWGNFSSIYAVGDWGRILRYDGNRWTTMDHPLNGESLKLYSVWGTTEQLVIAGENGIIMKYNGAEWTQIQSNTNITLYAVYMNNNKMFIVGEKGTIIEYDNGTFFQMNSPTSNNLYSLHYYNSRLYAAGDNGTILSYPMSELGNGYSVTEVSLAQQYALSLAEMRAYSEYQQMMVQKEQMIADQNQIIAYQSSQIDQMFSQNEMDMEIAQAVAIEVSKAVAEKDEEIQQLHQTIASMYTQDDINLLISSLYTQQELDLAIENALVVKNEELAQYQQSIDDLNQLIASKNLDIDCNGHVDALTDGLLIIRYMFNLDQGDSFTNNAVDLSGSCITEEELRQNIRNLLP